MLFALTDSDSITDAYQRLADRLRQDAETFTRNVGWQGGGGEFAIYWHTEVPLWGLVDIQPGYPWFGFGQNDPNDVKTFGNIMAQISFGLDGSRRRPGIFARDANGVLHVAHSGGIGGGKPGVGKNSFLDYYADQPGSHFTYVHWTGKVKQEYIPFGPLDAPDLLERIAHFVRVVERFRASI